MRSITLEKSQMNQALINCIWFLSLSASGSDFCRLLFLIPHSYFPWCWYLCFVWWHLYDARDRVGFTLSAALNMKVECHRAEYACVLHPIEPKRIRYYYWLYYIEDYRYWQQWVCNYNVAVAVKQLRHELCQSNRMAMTHVWPSELFTEGEAWCARHNFICGSQKMISKAKSNSLVGG